MFLRQTLSNSGGPNHPHEPETVIAQGLLPIPNYRCTDAPQVQMHKSSRLELKVKDTGEGLLNCGAKMGDFVHCFCFKE